ncbi:methionyl-tRNA formyltransferase [Puia dinghuensis]|uniref:Methionyl-tRNA formyltransferase n=1 Tax=Puia dinghuensis TaxID=1792502 RepID=A0A8J2UIQ3_9BACT|nr:methionyl-tRNA formyltransferase [Puia dinghuensis]GGB21754.1 methionyl-tRNA formyltransferase [Puia dinghuensis]
MPTNPRIVFMGTPEFAVASLEALLDAGCMVVAVVTAPDKPAGRGMQLTESAVKKYAQKEGLPILQPEKLRDPGFLEALRAFRADLQIVVAFRMLPEIVWDMPPMGTVNLHGSLLPQYRGAAPINWAVINGETETGVTTFQLQHQIDTGSILLQDRFPIADTDTAGDVHDRMMVIGAQLLVRTVEGLATGTLRPKPQENPTDLKHAPKIFTETGHIDWNKPTFAVYNLIRGLSPFPAAFTQLDGKLLKIYRAEKVLHTLAPDVAPGVYDTDGKTYLRFATADGYIRVTELQLEGKKKMAVTDFLRGYRFNSLPGH